MKKINITLLIFVFATTIANAQKKLNLMLKYDKDFDRYEVFVKPNFSQKNFTWGPSQISLVIPSNVLVDKVKIKNLDGGAWDDNSIIIAPEIASDKSFHGISSGGDKTDLTEGHESVLFYFSLPNNVKPDLVKIFDNETDPKSNERGMLGGDFRNTIVDMSGKDWFSEVYFKEKPKTEQENFEEKVSFEAIVYPNIIIDNQFQVSLKGVSENDGDILMILADATGKEILRQRASKTNLEKQTFRLSNTTNVEGIVVKFITSKGTISKRLIAEK
jgi:hypothetical protein